MSWPLAATSVGGPSAYAHGAAPSLGPVVGHFGSAHVRAVRLSVSIFLEPGGALDYPRILAYANEVVSAIAAQRWATGCTFPLVLLDMVGIQTLTSSSFWHELDVTTRARAVALALSDGLPLPRGFASSSRVPALLCIDDLPSQLVEVVRFAALLAAPLYTAGWAAAFAMRFVAYADEINAGFNLLSGGAYQLPTQTTLESVLGVLRTATPFLLTEDPDLAIAALVRRGLPRPALVVVPPGVSAQSPCPTSTCSREGLVLREPSQKGALHTGLERVECGVCAYSVYCSTCKTTFNISYSQRSVCVSPTALGGGFSKSKVRTYYPGATKALVFQFSERGVIHTSLLRSLDKDVYHGKASFQAMANMALDGDEIAGDGSSHHELNDAWFLYSVLRIMGLMGRETTFSLQGSDRDWLNRLIGTLSAELTRDGHWYDFMSERHKSCCPWPSKIWNLDGHEKLVQVICLVVGCWKHPSLKFVTCAEHRSLEPTAAVKSALALETLAIPILAPEDDVRNSMQHPETVPVARRSLRPTGNPFATPSAAALAKAGRDAAARAAAASAFEEASAAGICGSADGDDTEPARRIWRTSHGVFIVSCNCKFILGGYPMERSENLAEVWPAVLRMRAKCLQLADDLVAASPDSPAAAAAAAELRKCPAGLVFDRADALLLHIVRKAAATVGAAEAAAAAVVPQSRQSATPLASLAPAEAATASGSVASLPSATGAVAPQLRPSAAPLAPLVLRVPPAPLALPAPPAPLAPLAPLAPAEAAAGSDLAAAAQRPDDGGGFGGGCGARFDPHYWVDVQMMVDRFHEQGHTNLFHLGYTQSTDALLAKAMYAVKSTVSETNNARLARLKYHLNRMSALRAHFYIQVFMDLHNAQLAADNRRLVKQANARAAKGLAPKAPRSSLVKYVVDKIPSCIPHHCWQPELHGGAAGCGLSLVKGRYPIVVSLRPLIVSSSDGEFPTLVCKGFNSFGFHDRDSYGIVRRIIGHRYDHDVAVDDDATPGQMRYIKRDEYLVDWQPAAAREWPPSWEPAENLAGGVASVHIDTYLAAASAHGAGKVPKLWKLPGISGSSSAQPVRGTKRPAQPSAASARGRGRGGPKGGRGRGRAAAGRAGAPFGSERGGSAADGRAGDIA